MHQVGIFIFAVLLPLLIVSAIISAAVAPYAADLASVLRGL
jgi:hypothetical protein